MAELLSGHVSSWDLQGQLLHSGLQNETHGTCVSFLVWRAKTSGCIIKRGGVVLPAGSVLLLEGQGVHFHGMTFTGTLRFLHASRVDLV